MPYDLPPLRFADDALEPAIGAGALRAHHEVVHKGYADAINKMIAPYPDLAGRTIEDVLREPEGLPAEVRDAALDVGGAHANHQFFWKVIGPNGGEPEDALADAIVRDFGGIEGFKAAFTSAALDLDGPGFAFLSLAAPKAERLEVLVLPQNGSVLTFSKPGVLVCDLWEHAWKADHPTLAAWIEAFWGIVDWRVCRARYEALRKGETPE